ncbi:MAG: type II toxin-antitoxin system RelE/ParE family toxin [Smithellaceae bacterium]|nr:type II toxin-antitoxin system RelE/ParE family toxin [Smithellaceae bacterium]
MKIEWTEPALLDLESIRDYIRKDSEYYASHFIGRIIESVERLEYFPEMGRKVPEAGEDEGVRELLFQNYRIMYRSEPQRILILTIIHAARDISLIEPKPWDIV